MKGVAMGNHLAPSLAIIFMHTLGGTAVKHYSKAWPEFYDR